jgi:two-component system response regulator HydG
VFPFARVLIIASMAGSLLDSNEARDVDVTQEHRPVSVTQPCTGGFLLSVIHGPDRGLRVPIDGRSVPRLLIGQNAGCAIRLSDACVSRRHAALDVTETLKITDLASTNGTFVDGVSIIEAVVRPGQCIRTGNTVFRVEAAFVPDNDTAFEEGFGRFLGSSAEVRRLYPVFKKLAVSAVPLLIEGETGTGKEVLAEAIHEASPRSTGPFLVFDCTTVAASIIESELFGHERGAFTGAVSARRGIFEESDHGTLFIDEVGDLDLSLQSKLLRAIERSEIRRVGGSRSLRIDVRVIAATRRNIDREVREGRFRDDLFYRLAVGRVELPPLRQRTGDVRFLAEHFWSMLSRDGRPLPANTIEKWENQRWAGNVRELYNAVARQLALGESAQQEFAQAEETKDFIDSVVSLGLAYPVARDRVHREFERRFIAHVLAKHGNNVAKAAAASGIARRYFQVLRARQAR